MKKILDIITDEMKKAFAANGYDETFAKVNSVQPPGSLRIPVQRRDGSRQRTYKKKPIDIANGVVEQLKDSEVFEEVNAVMPGFINLKLDPAFLSGYMNGMKGAKKLGMDEVEKPETIIIDLWRERMLRNGFMSVIFVLR